MESDHQVGLGILNFKILFTSMINYMKFTCYNYVLKPSFK
jgi:hypothetical protein